MLCVLFGGLGFSKIKVFASGVVKSNVLLRTGTSIFFLLLMKQVSIWLASSIRALITERKRTEKCSTELLEED